MISMKHRPAFLGFFSVMLLVCLSAATARAAGTNAAPAAASTNAPAIEVPLPVSTFELTVETRDPFFPASLRQAVTNAVAKAVPAFNASNFVLKGLSGGAGHRLAVINNRTFAIGEKYEVTTPTGKVPITCEEIKEQSVIIRTETSLEPIELTLRKGAQ